MRSPLASRKIGTIVYTCQKLPAEQALSLLLDLSATFAPVPGLLEAVALGGDNPELVPEFFVLAEGVEASALRGLIKRLAALPIPRGGPEAALPPDAEALASLALFAISAQFADYLSRKSNGPAPKPPRDPDAVTLTAGEIKVLGPNIAERAYLLRPTAYHTSEPICTLTELRTVLTIDDLADAHEAMDIREYHAAKAAAAKPKGARRGR